VNQIEREMNQKITNVEFKRGILNKICEIDTHI
jgi:hypothetical protein